VKIELTVKQTVEVKFVKICIPLRYGDEDVSYDFPFRNGDKWEALIDLDTGAIQNWPKGVSANLQTKVCDEGSYTLLNENKEDICFLDGGYVPSFIPGKYGDYIDLDIDKSGKILNWDVDSKDVGT